jgi:hypothetical protein
MIHFVFIVLLTLLMKSFIRITCQENSKNSCHRCIKLSAAIIWSTIVQLVTQEYDFDLVNGFSGVSETIKSLPPAANVFQLVVHRAEVQSY